jgi:hypothetical protein
MRPQRTTLFGMELTPDEVETLDCKSGRVCRGGSLCDNPHHIAFWCINTGQGWSDQRDDENLLK